MATRSKFKPHPFSKEKLQAADVLLSCGTDPISRFICEMDKGIYSHAAVWDGHNVVEAAVSGVRKWPLEKEISAQRYVDVYRWRTDSSPNKKMMGEKGYPPDPVTTRADEIAAAGERYSNSELLMGALVIWLSKRPKKYRQRIMIRLLGDKIERWIRNLIADPSKRGTTCTEVVCRSFRDAQQPPDYGISIRIGGPRIFRNVPAVWMAVTEPHNMSVELGPSSDGHDATARKFGSLFMQAVEPEGSGLQLIRLLTESQHAGRLQLITPLAESLRAPLTLKGQAPLSFVTPRELQNSPNLEYMGRLPGTLKRFLPGSVWVDMFGEAWDALKTWLTPYAPVPLRLGIGGLFLLHGIGNLASGLSGVAQRLHGVGLPFASVLAPMLVGVETLGGAGMLLGWLTSVWATLFAVVTILALWRIPGACHSALRWILLASALSLVPLGDGSLSLMGWLKKRRKGR